MFRKRRPLIRYEIKNFRLKTVIETGKLLSRHANILQSENLNLKDNCVELLCILPPYKVENNYNIFVNEDVV